MTVQSILSNYVKGGDRPVDEAEGDRLPRGLLYQRIVNFECDFAIP